MSEPGPDDISRSSTGQRTASTGPSAVPSSRSASSAGGCGTGFLHWSDIAVFGFSTCSRASGVTVGPPAVHHRSFATKPWLRGFWRVRLCCHRGTGHLMGGRCITTPSPISRATHSPRRSRRRLARRTARPGTRAWAALPARSPDRASSTRPTSPTRGELRRPPFLAWAIGGLGAAFGLGWLIGGTFTAALTAAVGGAVRCLSCITSPSRSLAVPFLRARRFGTGDESRNLAWLSLLSFGGHGTTTTFPTSAATGCAGTRWTPQPLIEVSARGLVGRRASIRPVSRRSCWPRPPQQLALAKPSPAQRPPTRSRAPVHRRLPGTGPVPATAPGRASPCARRAPSPALCAPGQLGLGRPTSPASSRSTTSTTIDLLQTWKPPLRRAAKARFLALAAARRWASSARRRAQSEPSRGAPALDRARPGARCATATTCRLSSSRSSWTSR